MISGRLVGVLGANVRRQAARIRRRSGPSTERRGGSWRRRRRRVHYNITLSFIVNTLGYTLGGSVRVQNGTRIVMRNIIIVTFSNRVYFMYYIGYRNTYLMYYYSTPRYYCILVIRSSKTILASFHRYAMEK